MAHEPLITLNSSPIAQPDLVTEITRGRRVRSAGWVGVIGSIAVYLLTKLIALPGGTTTAILGAVLIASVTLIAWTRVWQRESKEPFQYTFSVGGFEWVPSRGTDTRPPNPDDPLEWLEHDLTEKLSERVRRLSLLDDSDVPDTETDDLPASHVHISGWCGFRYIDGWQLEVVPKVRLGGSGSAAKLASSVRFRLSHGLEVANPEQPPTLDPEDYTMLFERVYWSVASEIYAQIRRGVEEKVNLLPRGRLRAGAYMHEADDYANSNTLDAYEAARKLYRRALEIYDIRSRDAPATRWRRRWAKLLHRFDSLRRRFRRWRAKIWKRSGRLEVLTARAALGYARMMVAEWHLRLLCGMAPREIYEAAEIIDKAVERLEAVPSDVPDQQLTLFRARVARASTRRFLRDRPGAQESLTEAERLLPARAREDADFLFAAGMIEPDHLRGLRLLGQAVELDPTMERAHFHRAQRYEEIWRRRETFEPEIAKLVDDEYRAVTALNPGNLSAWAHRGYLGWLLAEGDGEEPDNAKMWGPLALSALEAGRQYKEVRREAVVAELDWNLARLAAEGGKFLEAYEHYIQAVSAKLAEPRIEFEEHFYLSCTDALVQRFESYRETVMRRAREAEGRKAVEPRLIESVKAFVLNDCGNAYLAHHDRSGKEKDLKRAEAEFRKAHRLNKGFVLPSYNLAKLHHKTADLPGASASMKEEQLHAAATLLGDVLRREPDWPPAQLLSVTVQAKLASAYAAQKKYEEERTLQIAQTASDNESDIGLSRAAPVLELEEKQERCRTELESELRKLLPHNSFYDEDGFHKVDAGGTQVKALIDDRNIRWTRDFSAVHVDALGRWAQSLVASAPGISAPFCAMLRNTFYRADVEFLVNHRESALLDPANGWDGDADDLPADALECEELLCQIVEAELKDDPIHLLSLKNTSLLPEGKRRAALAIALDAKPKPSSTALLWVGDALKELGDSGEAMTAYRRAAEEGGASVAPVASRSLAELLEETGAATEAIDFYRATAKSDSSPVAASGVAGAARVLLAQAKPDEARLEYEAVRSRPEIALFIQDYVDPEGRSEDLALIYRMALEAEGLAVEQYAEFEIRLALALGAATAQPQAEAAEHLQNAANLSISPIRWEATVLLARILAKSDAEQAKQLYRRTLDEKESDTAIVTAAWDLGALMEENGETEAAYDLYRSCAQGNKQVANRFAEFLREREDPIAATFLGEVEEQPVG